jgi:hypothetical protein
MAIDISKLNAAELDELIAEAAERRLDMKPYISYELPRSIGAIFDPRWVTHLHGENTILQLRHPGRGWVAFAFPPHEGAHLLSLFLRFALAPKKPEDQAGPASAGGTVH